jgi:short-subunit dehydrogenase
MDALRIEEHDHGVHVLTVCPGFVRTNISLNALTASGDRHARMDTSTDEGLDPGPVAAEILAGIEHRKREIYPAGSLEKLSFYLARFAPPMLDRMLLKRFRTPGGFA